MIRTAKDKILLLKGAVGVTPIQIRIHPAEIGIVTRDGREEGSVMFREIEIVLIQKAYVVGR